MDRVLVNAPATLSKQWTDNNGANVDPGVVTIGIVRGNGTVLVAAGTATSGSGTSPRTYALTTTHTALLDRLTVTWTSPTLGALTTVVEVVGGFLFSVAEGVAAGLTASEVPAKLVNAEQELETACRVAFVPRYARESVACVRSNGVLPLRWPLIRAVRSVTINNVAVAGEIDITRSGLYRLGWWPSVTWATPAVVEYEHGYDFPPGGAGRAALALAKRSDPDPNAAGQVIQAQAGQEMIQYAPPTTVGRFGNREVDAFVQSMRVPLVA